MNMMYPPNLLASLVVSWVSQQGNPFLYLQICGYSSAIFDYWSSIFFMFFHGSWPGKSHVNPMAFDNAAVKTAGWGEFTVPHAYEAAGPTDGDLLQAMCGGGDGGDAESGGWESLGTKQIINKIASMYIIYIYHLYIYIYIIFYYMTMYIRMYI